MDIILLGITVVALVVAFVMSTAAWRLMREEKQRSAARVAALSVAATSASPARESFAGQPLSDFASENREKPLVKAPWSAPRIVPAPVVPAPTPLPTVELPLHQPARHESARGGDVLDARENHGAPIITHASGFLGATEAPPEDSGRQKSLAFAAMFLFVILSGGLLWMMSGPRGTTPVAVGPNSPLELVSLSHARQDKKLAVSGLVRNPAAGKPVERLSAVVFLFDRMGTFVTSSRANVDFLKLGAGDESPFVVSLDAPPTVSRYRVSFRTDDGIVPHIDRRSDPVSIQESTVKSSVISQQ